MARCTVCVFGTRARCLVCGNFGPRPGRLWTPERERDEQMRAHPGSWRNNDRERAPGVDDIAGWDDGNPWG